MQPHTAKRGPSSLPWGVPCSASEAARSTATRQPRCVSKPAQRLASHSSCTTPPITQRGMWHTTQTSGSKAATTTGCVAHCIGVTKGSCNAPDMCSRHPSRGGGALDERCEPCPSQEGGRGRREHQSGGLAHHHCRVRRARQTGPASRHGDEAGRAAGVGRLAAHGDLAGARPLGQHCFETAAAVAVPGPRQRRRLVQAGSQPG